MLCYIFIQCAKCAVFLDDRHFCPTLVITVCTFIILPQCHLIRPSAILHMLLLTVCLSFTFSLWFKKMRSKRTFNVKIKV